MRYPVSLGFFWVVVDFSEPQPKFLSIYGSGYTERIQNATKFWSLDQARQYSTTHRELTDRERDYICGIERAYRAAAQIVERSWRVDIEYIFAPTEPLRVAMENEDLFASIDEARKNPGRILEL